MSFVDRCTKEDQSFLEAKEGDFFNACGISFNTIEHPKAVEMFKAFRTSFKPPSRKDIGGKLLNDAYNRAVQENRRRLSGKEAVTMLVAGWKNSSSNKKILTTAFQVGKAVAFVKYYDTSNISETGDTLAEIAEMTRDNIKEMYNSSSLVTDGAANMRSMGKKVSMVYLTSDP